MKPMTSRRALLKATGAGAALLPFVPILESRAADQRTPKRLVFFYTSNGTVRERWLPTVTSGQLVLSDILKPLEPHKSELLVVDGLDYMGGWSGHHLAVPLTGSKPVKVDAKENWLSASISVDQYVANAIGASTKLRSLEIGIQVPQYAAWVAALSYRGGSQPMLAENNPYKVFDRAFAGLMPSTATPNAAFEQLRLDRKSVIDLVNADLQRLRPRLGADEQAKMDAHLDNIRQIERTLTAGTGAAATASCKAPAAPKFDHMNNDNIPMLSRLTIDLITMALACDLTRVGTLQHGRGGGEPRFTWLGPEFLQDPAYVKGVDEVPGIHSLAHAELQPVARDRLTRCHTWYAGEVAALVSKLATIPEGTGTMADNTLVVWMNEQGTGNHSMLNTPWVMVGRAGGVLKTGRLLQFPRQPHNRLLVSICNAMGLPDTTFGDPDLGKAGALPGLMA